MHAVAERVNHAPVERMSLHRAPSALALYDVFRNRPRTAGTHNNDIGLIALAEKTAPAHIKKACGIVAHKLYEPFYRHNFIIYKLEHRHERELYHWHAGGRTGASALLVGPLMGGMVGAYY